MTDLEHLDNRMDNRVLPALPFESLADYVAVGGGKGLEAAGAVSAETVIEELVASGLRGRGGAGFPTGVKWRTIKSFASDTLRTAVIVNAAEGEPGTYKDRTIIRANPYAVLEGALIAARVMDANSIVIATKAEFKEAVDRLRAAIIEVAAAGWCAEVDVQVAEGPSEYLYGEETALLEVIDGRPPFPRIAPPFRRGIVEVVKSDDDIDSGSGLAADVEMATTDATSAAPPVLVNNVETMANIAAIVARGADWFRSVGTPESPGTIVCTITGAVRKPGVAELRMGTTLRQAIDVAGGGLVPGVQVKAVLVGVSNTVLTADQLDTELSYEAMKAIGSGLGSAGFIIVGDNTSAIGIAAGASRFLAVESCGQCTPCKQDGAEIAELLGKMARAQAAPNDLAKVRKRLGTITTGARCSLATQHQAVVGSLLDAFAEQIEASAQPGATPVEVELVAALEYLDDQGARLDTSFANKQLDWTYDPSDSGKSPVERFTDHRATETDDG
ncbi:MAG: NADH-ubiquinone oxidoreductase-F iron-sulfur binding region domain-containing protein [Ilumatobacteraceae bacterium]